MTTTSFLADRGGDGYSVMKEKKLSHITGPLDTDVFEEYLKLRSPVVQGVDRRIVKVTNVKTNGARGSIISQLSQRMPQLLLITSLLAKVVQ